jgi:acyl dehydratase
MQLPSTDTSLQPVVYTQAHIDAARFATDDFNPFHDKRRWQKIAGNPFSGPLVLGFQLAALVEEAVRQHRLEHGEATLIARHALHYSNYQLSFAAAVVPGQTVQAEVRHSKLDVGGNPQLGNRVVLRADGTPALLGFKRESAEPLLSLTAPPLGAIALRAWPDRSYLPDGRTFLKRKFPMTGNAKTFLLGAGVEPSVHIDEIENRVGFPEMFPLSYLSCALLERGRHAGHDFTAAPLVYVAHRYSLDRRHLATLASNDVLHLLVHEPVLEGAEGARRHTYPCSILLSDGRVLCSAELVLMPLSALVAA